MKNYPKRLWWSVPFLIIALLLGSCSPEPDSTATAGGGEANPELQTNARALKEWQDMRFGMFVHCLFISLLPLPSPCQFCGERELPEIQKKVKRQRLCC